MKGTDNLIVEHPLVVIHVAGIIGTETIEVLGQLGQVIGTACLVHGRFGGRAHRQHLCVGLTEHLAVAYASHCIAVSTLNHRPEVLGKVIVIGIGIAAIRAQGTRHHRYVLVGVPCADGIDVPG